MAALLSWQPCFWRRIIENKAALSFWIFGALYIIGIFYSTSTSAQIFRDVQKQHWLLITPFFIAALTEEKWRLRMINAFVAAMTLTLILSYSEVVTNISLPWKNSYLELSCVFMNHIVQSFALCLTAVIVGYRLLFLKIESMIEKIFYVALWIAIAFNIFAINEGRTGYLLFVLLMTYLFFQRFRTRGFLIALGVSAGVMFVAFNISPAFHQRVVAAYEDVNQYRQDHAKAKTTPVGQRVEMIDIAHQMMTERPWFGYGTGGIRTALPQVVSQQDRVFNPLLDYVESIYVNMVLQFGVVGLCVLFLMAMLQWIVSFRLPEQYRILIQSVLMMIFIGGVANGFLVSFPITHIYALFSALCFSALTIGKRHTQNTAKMRT